MQQIAWRSNVENIAEECGRCDKPESLELGKLVPCACGDSYHEGCLNKHLKSKANSDNARSHYNLKEKKPSRFSNIWSWAKVEPQNSEALKKTIEEDESNKWFGVYINDDVGYLKETKRFNNLMESSKHSGPESPPRQFPSIVSFVGETGAGKSTLIRMLIKMSTSEGVECESTEAPQAGSNTGAINSATSTSGEVNLYKDPASFGTESPMFYADCEGLGGGKPLCHRYQRNWMKLGCRSYHLESGRDRKSVVNNLYPRFLYIFSDVVCLVASNARKLGEIAEQLLEWAEKGATGSINQFALPAVVIIINKPDQLFPEWLEEDLEKPADDFFKIIQNDLPGSEKLLSFSAKYAERDIRKLFKRRFSNVTVVYIPLEGYRSEGSEQNIEQQMQRLQASLSRERRRVQAERAEVWTRFDDIQYSLLFAEAFKHLAEGSDRPFDFAASRKSEVPTTMEGRMVDLLRVSVDPGIDENIRFAANVIGSAIMRRELKQNGTEILHHWSSIFNEELRRSCVAAFKTYRSEYAVCGYVSPEDHRSPRTRCWTTLKGHTKGHQSREGLLLEEGDFQGDLDGVQETFVEIVKKRIILQLSELDGCSTDTEARWTSMKKVHKQILQNPPDPKTWTSVKDLKPPITGTCLACLCNCPRFIMPCSHALCEDCVRDYQFKDGKKRPSVIHVHESCLLCKENNMRSGWPWKIQVIPKTAGVRLLSLDGGGVRGVVEIKVLQRLEKEIGLSLPIVDFFDLMVGTSAGGIIALGLGANRWSTADCFLKFTELSKNVFQSKFLAKTWGIGLVTRMCYESIYKTETLETALQSAFGLTKTLRGTSSDDTESVATKHNTRIAITTTVEGGKRLFTNYHPGGQVYLDPDTTIWEIARCTSAAPMYFTSYNPPKVGIQCYDGGLKNNNPVGIAVEEGQKAWPDRRVDLLLSIGAGCARKPPKPRKIMGFPEWILDTFNQLMANMSGEKMWKDFVAAQQRGHQFRQSRRLNVVFKDPQEPELDDTLRMLDMSAEADNFDFPSRAQDEIEGPCLHPSSSQEIDFGTLPECAYLLIASLFYFHITDFQEKSDERVWNINGTICCRIEQNPTTLKELLAKVARFQVRYDQKDTKTEKDKPTEASIENGFYIDHKIQIETHPEAMKNKIHIEVVFTNGIVAAISGFPYLPGSLKERFFSSY